MNEKNFSFIVLKLQITNTYLPVAFTAVGDAPALVANVRPGVEEELPAVAAVVLDLVGDAVAAERANEVLDVVLCVDNDFRCFDVVNVVSAVVAACAHGLDTLVARHIARQVAVVADVDNLVALITSALMCLGNNGAANTAHQVLDAALPLVAARRDCPEVHAVDDCVAEVAAVVAVVVGLGHEAGRSEFVLDLADALLDIVACHFDVGC